MNSFNETMNEEKPESIDILGIRPISDAINTVTETTMKEASEFIGLICKPAAEDFGFLLQDIVKYWRLKNLSIIAIKSKKILNAQNNDIEVSATPRIVNSILENGSWIDNDKIQDMWSGLLASSCTKDGKDESNLIFINLLSQLTSSEVRILNYICNNSEKNLTIHNIISAKKLSISLKDLQEISGVVGIHNLDREIDHLRSLGLLLGGFPGTLKDTINAFKRPSDIRSKTLEDFEADISPTALAFNMYVRCNGSLQAPIEYFGLRE
jgi:hypothetical protein